MTVMSHEPTPALHQPFARYVDIAREGRNTLWRILFGTLLIAVVWFVAQIAVIIAGGVVVSLREGEALSADDVIALISGGTLFTGQMGLALVLCSIIPIWFGVWLAVRLLHRRLLSGVLGIARRVDRGDFVRATAVALIVSFASLLLGEVIDPGFSRSNVGMAEWFGLLPVMLLLVLLQVSAEEVLFRGYLQQSLAARFASPLIWLVLPALMFTSLHWRGAAPLAMNLAGATIYLGFSLVMTALVVASGNLGAAIGAHFGSNVVALLFFSQNPELGGGSLFVGPSFFEAGRSNGQVALIVLAGLAASAMMAALLLWRASPLRLHSLSRPSPLG